MNGKTQTHGRLAARGSSSPSISRGRVRVSVLLILSAAAVTVCLSLALPFLPAITWALALAIVANPLHSWIERRLPGKPDMASAVATGIVAVGILAPVVLVVQQLAQQLTAGLAQLQAMIETGALEEMLQGDRRLAPILRWLEQNSDVKKEIGSFAAGFRPNVGGWIKGTVMTAMQLLITLFLLFYLFRDRKQAVRAMRSYLPLSGRESDGLLERVRSMVHATVFGSLTVAGIQGLLGGLMFWALGLPGALLWGAVMGFFAIIPVVGTFLVWVPAAVFLALKGSWVKAVILTLWGVFVVSLIDNLLYPLLVGKEVRIHTALVFLSIAGGLDLFGVSGLVLGPVALVTAMGLIDVVSQRSAGAAEGTAEPAQA